MKAEKEKNAAKPRAKDGSRWRSGTSKMPTSNYAETVLAHKPNPNRQPKPAAKEKAPKNFVPTDPNMFEPKSVRQNSAKQRKPDPAPALEAIPM